ncbi:MAG: hypothetical protein LBR20_05790 [Propionibacteriaceae bacterium]|jgi:hypothetical protein|nr:hypothetical protein [Propionibacteriaceae bacterium]
MSTFIPHEGFYKGALVVQHGEMGDVKLAEDGTPVSTIPPAEEFGCVDSSGRRVMHDEILSVHREGEYFHFILEGARPVLDWNESIKKFEPSWDLPELCIHLSQEETRRLISFLSANLVVMSILSESSEDSAR